MSVDELRIADVYLPVKFVDDWKFVGGDSLTSFETALANGAGCRG